MLDRTGGGARARARWPFRALPVSIGSISLSSCQLFLCVRQIVAGGAFCGDGSRASREREREGGEKGGREKTGR